MFARLSVRARLVTCATVLAVFGLTLVVGSAMLGLDRIKRETAATLTAAETLEGAKEMVRVAQIHFAIQLQEWKNLLLRGIRASDAEALRQALAQFTAEEQGVQATLKEVGRFAQASNIAELQVDDVVAAHATLGEKYRLALKGYEEGGVFEVDAQVKALDGIVQQKIEQLAKQTVLLSRKLSKNQQQTLDSIIASTIWRMLVFAIAVVLLVAAGIALACRAITKPLDIVLRAMADLVDGKHNLKLRLPRLGGEFDQLSASLNSFVGRLNDLVANVSSASQAVQQSAVRINQGNRQLAARAEHHAATLQQTSASMDELSGAIKDNANNAQQVDGLAREAKRVSEQGGRVVREVVTTMNRLHKDSSHMSEIVAAIDAIAFQTNILALNAAVEAARAGDSGRGFAVVASEVRVLAQRCGTSAKEIKQLIASSTDRVHACNRLVGEAGSTMEQIVAATAKVSDLMSNTSAMSREQTARIEQVTRAVVATEALLQKDVHLVQDSADAAHSLTEEAEHLARAVQSMHWSDSA